LGRIWYQGITANHVTSLALISSGKRWRRWIGVDPIQAALLGPVGRRSVGDWSQGQVRHNVARRIREVLHAFLQLWQPF
jgi:hypothetical protein